MVAVHLVLFIGWRLFLSNKSNLKKIGNSDLQTDRAINDHLLAPDKFTMALPIIDEKILAGKPEDENLENEFAKSLLTPEVEMILQLPESVELYSLESKYLAEPKVAEEYFHHFKILGKVDLTIDQMAIAIDQIETIVYDVNHNDKDFCFNPRHGLKIASEGKTVEFLISFECSKMQIFSKTIIKYKELPISGNADELNKILREHQIELQLEPPANK